VEVDVFIFPFIGNVEGGGGKGVNLRATYVFSFATSNSIFLKYNTYTPTT